MEKRRLGDLLKAVTLLKHHGLHATGITEAYHARRVAPLMVHMLSLYQMALTASLEGTMLSWELLHNSKIEQCILEAMEVNVVTFKFPITGHPVVRPDLSFIEMVCFFLVPGYQPLAGPSFSTPRSEGHPRATVEPIGGLAFELLGLHGP
jgi:hypothetical protein